MICINIFRQLQHFCAFPHHTLFAVKAKRRTGTMQAMNIQMCLDVSSFPSELVHRTPYISGQPLTHKILRLQCAIPTHQATECQSKRRNKDRLGFHLVFSYTVIHQPSPILHLTNPWPRNPVEDHSRHQRRRRIATSRRYHRR